MLKEKFEINLLAYPLLILILSVVGNAKENIKGGKTSANRDENTKRDAITYQDITVETKIVPDFNNIFDDMEKIRNAIPVENNINLPYEEMFFFRKKQDKTENKKYTEKISEEMIKNLLNDSEDKISDSDLGTELYNKGSKMLSSYQSSKIEAYSLLLNASRMGSKPAKAKVAWELMCGTYLPQNISMAKELFEQLAEEGVPDGHTGMGFLHSLGLTVNASQARALLHYTVGALGGSHWSKMILGFRYWNGISVTANCEKSLEFYRQVASHVASRVEANGGVVVHRIRLLDQAEDPGYQTGLIDNDLKEYYEMLADKGDVSAQVGLGQLYYRGAKGFSRDYGKALLYFQKAAEAGNIIAMAFMGKIYLEGDENVKVNLMKAYLNFKKSADFENAIGQYGIGLMYLEGKYVEKNNRKALFYLSRSADQGWAESLLLLGTMYLHGTELKKDYKMARKYFIMVSQVGHTLGYFNLGQMHASGIGTMRSCTTAVELFKTVAERGNWGTHLMEAYNHYKNNRYNQSFVIYALLAEMGYEVAQNNVAFLLDNGLFTYLDRDEENRYVRAKTYWSRSAMQGNPSALIKLGDYYYYGLGTKEDYETAATYYRVASEQFRNPQAMFNLGYMHEQGLGLKRDLHLAKRCYDMASEASPDAEFPVLIALTKLYFMSAICMLKELDWSQVLALQGVNAYLGHNWDLYLCGFLCFCITYIIHFRVNRRDLLRDMINFL
ncbi:unnamed protein product [Nezara viridula]|uniref:Neuropeptide n=1 Tax=Nezara viridula TaxID=85310 RepID=A0A9P0MJS0_NEZVI|nr:unnamed protein product [Nezara viridula]